ncbi:MAG TPA: hypothetical protein VER32_03810 [Pyrinomonadaceae bacterium]|nr:hypothetical protein [Pyrinomonadaceae bacterium]
MKLLILGGTMFLGRHLTEAALARGHEVTLFNRGRHNPELFPEVEKLRGERDGGLEVLRGRVWDAVIDTSGFVPRVVRASAALLAPSVKRYVFISSISVFADFSRPVEDEGAPLGALAGGSAEEVTGESYGPMKALCERAVEEELPGRALNIRPGLIVGPHDTTVRFVYWPRRVARGGEVLAPGRPDAGVQVIDARDLAEWTLGMTEEGATGVYNATGPATPLAFGELLEECRRVSRSDARFTWVAEEFLLEAGVEPWSELPLWLPEGGEAGERFRHFQRVGVAKALAAGLTFRPLAETIRDTLVWDESRGGAKAAEGKAGVAMPDKTMTPERERELLAAWRDAPAPAAE